MARGIVTPEREPRPTDDYVVDQEARARRLPIARHIVRVMQGLLLVVLVMVSLGLFWLVGLMLGVL